jgi:hypothetical protein
MAGATPHRCYGSSPGRKGTNVQVSDKEVALAVKRAVHEAGHAAIAWRRGVAVERIGIRADDHFYDQIAEIAVTPGSSRPWDFDDPAEIAEAESLAMTYLGGPIATGELLGTAIAGWAQIFRVIPRPGS